MWVQVVGHLTYLLIALSYTVRDIVWLRIVAVLASAASIVFNYVAPETPLWLVINWNIVFLAVNLFELYRGWRESRMRVLTAEEHRLAATVLDKLTPKEASRLICAAKWRSMNAGETLVQVGEQLTSLMLITDGEIEVATSNGRKMCRAAGTFIGEVSFVTGELASATVIATKSLRCLCWSFYDLHALMARQPQIALVLQRIICADLSAKLRNQSMNDDTNAAADNVVLGSTDGFQLVAN